MFMSKKAYNLWVHLLETGNDKKHNKREKKLKKKMLKEKKGHKKTEAFMKETTRIFSAHK